MATIFDLKRGSSSGRDRRTWNIYRN